MSFPKTTNKYEHLFNYSQSALLLLCDSLTLQDGHARTLFGAQWDDVSHKPMPNLLVPLFVRTISVGSEDVLKIWIAREWMESSDISEMKEPHKQHKQHKPTLPTNLLIPWVRCTWLEFIPDGEKGIHHLRHLKGNGPSIKKEGPILIYRSQEVQRQNFAR